MSGGYAPARALAVAGGPLTATMASSCWGSSCCPCSVDSASSTGSSPAMDAKTHLAPPTAGRAPQRDQPTKRDGPPATPARSHGLAVGKRHHGHKRRGSVVVRAVAARDRDLGLPALLVWDGELRLERPSMRCRRLRSQQVSARSSRIRPGACARGPSGSTRTFARS
jgi:hypothetical protein